MCYWKLAYHESTTLQVYNDGESNLGTPRAEGILNHDNKGNDSDNYSLRWDENIESELGRWYWQFSLFSLFIWQTHKRLRQWVATESMLDATLENDVWLGRIFSYFL